MNDSYADHRMLLEMMKASVPLMEADPEERHRLGLMQLIMAWFQKVFDAIDNGKKIAQCQFSLFSEICYAFDVQPNAAEVWSGIIFMATPDGHGAVPSFEAAEQWGLPPELCSAYKALIGGILRGTTPTPDMVLATSYPCDNSKMGDQVVEYVTGAPTFYMDAPYNLDEPEAMDFWVNQVKMLIAFMEEQTGKKLDHDRLKEVVEEANRSLEYWLETIELRKTVPLPQAGLGPVGLVNACTIAGTPESTAIMKLLRDDCEERIRLGKTAVPDEQLRILWWYLTPAHDIEICEWLEKERQAVSPLAFWDYTGAEPVDTSSTDSIIRGMAKRMLQLPMSRQGAGPVDIYINDCIDAVEEWKCDCVICAGHAGCKWLYASYGLLRDKLQEIGIPVMIFDADVFDPRVAGPESYRPQILDFVDSVLDKKQGG